MWKINWPDFTFPPINLWSIWPRKDQLSCYEDDMEEMYNRDVTPNNMTEEDKDIE